MHLKFAGEFKRRLRAPLRPSSPLTARILLAILLVVASISCFIASVMLFVDGQFRQRVLVVVVCGAALAASTSLGLLLSHRPPRTARQGEPTAQFHSALPQLPPGAAPQMSEVYVDDMSLQTSATSTGGEPAEGKQALTYAVQGDGPEPPSHELVLGSRPGWMRQRKDFRRDEGRDLTSAHGGYTLEQSGTGRLFVLAGSAIGAAHDQAGITREDAVAFAVNQSSRGGVVAAVADGLGSARLSHVASSMAAREAVELGVERLPDMPRPGQPGSALTWRRIADALVGEIAHVLAEKRVLYRAADLGMPSVGTKSRERVPPPATTLALVAVVEDDGGAYAWWLTVGDCEVAVTDTKSGTLNWLTPIAERDDRITAALPSTRIASLCGMTPLSAGQTLLAMTDGMARVIQDDSEQVTHAILAARNQDSALQDLMSALDNRVQGRHDDRSLVAVGLTHGRV